MLQLVRRLASVFGRRTEHSSTDRSKKFDRAARRLAEVRGDRVTALPADPGANSMENVAEAARDYGLSRFSGETDAMAGAAKSYRSSRRRTRPGRR